MLLIWKEHFVCGILSFSSPRCAMTAHLNVIYTKFRHGMIAQLNKIWHVWVCARSIAHHSWPGLEGEIYVCQEIYQKKLADCIAVLLAWLIMRHPLLERFLKDHWCLEPFFHQNFLNILNTLCNSILKNSNLSFKLHFL